MNLIESRHNPKFKRWLSLLEAKGIRKEQRALVSGEKLVNELLAEYPDAVEEILIPPKSEFQPEGIRVTKLHAALFKELDVIGTKRPLAVVRVPEISEWKKDPPRGLELIVSLSDPSNLGALLRSAQALGVRRVILTKECSSPYLPKALKAASLATFKLELQVTGSIHELDVEQAYALDMNGEDLAQFQWPKNALLLLGEEGQGVPSTLTLKRLKIQMAPGCESLNATVAAALALYSYRLQHR